MTSKNKNPDNEYSIEEIIEEINKSRLDQFFYFNMKELKRPGVTVKYGNNQYMFWKDYIADIVYDYFMKHYKNYSCSTEENLKNFIKDWLKKFDINLPSLENFKIKDEFLFKNDDFNNLINGIKKLKREFNVYHRIYGVSKSVDEKIKIGDYTFFPKNAKIFSLDIPVIDEMTSETTSYPFVGYSIQACDKEAAIELSYTPFLKLENILNLYSSEYHIGIVNVDDHRGVLHVISDGTELTMAATSYIEPLDLNLILKDPIILQILKKMSNNKKTDIDTRIINAAFWIGNAMKINDPPFSFIYCMIAIESLLTEEQNKLLDYSISAQIRDNVAFILFDDYESRYKMSCRMRDFYNLRSKSVHGVKEDISNKDYIELLGISKKILEKFIMDDKIKNMTKYEELRGHINTLRFG